MDGKSKSVTQHKGIIREIFSDKELFASSSILLG